MMKRFITLLVAVVMLLSCFSLFVSAKNDGILKADRVSAKAGDEITIPVTYEGNPGVCDIRVTIAYDTHAVEYVDITKSASNRFNYTINDQTEGEIIVLMSSQRIANVTGDLELFSVKFKVKSDAKSGRVLFPVYCEKGMAAAYVTENGKLTPVSLAPSTSSGSVTILCDEHTFDLEISDGAVQCSKCGAVKSSSGDVSIETDAGLPEVDVSLGNSSASDTSSEQGSAQNSVQQSEDGSENNEGDSDNGGDQGLKAGHFIPIAAAVLVAVLICVGVVVAKIRANLEGPQD